MKILIIGGGNVGIVVAEKLISEDHDVTIIEKDESSIQHLSNILDALVINGNGINTKNLIDGGVGSADLFLALTNDDNVNIVACSLAKKLNKKKLLTVAKVENYTYYFSEKNIEPAGFSIDEVIASKQITIAKIGRLIEEPSAIENIHLLYNKVQIIGMHIDKDYQYVGKTIIEITNLSNLLKSVRIVAIARKGKVIIPFGSEVILPDDKIFIIGKYEILQKILKTHFTQKYIIKNIVIVGGNELGRKLAIRQNELGKNVTIIEKNLKTCKKLSDSLENITIIHGYGTNQNILADLESVDTCIVCVTDDDEYNIISAVFGKKNNFSKAISLVRNVSIAPIIDKIAVIDSAFSPDNLTTSEILKYCRKGDIISITAFSEIDAEIIKLKISEKIAILDIPLKEVNFPGGMIVGGIYRDGVFIVPTGEDKIILGDIVVLFVLPSSIVEVEKLFSRKKMWKKK